MLTTIHLNKLSMWEKETRKGEAVSFVRSWGMIIGLVFLLISNEVNSVVLYFSSTPFCPNFLITVTTILIGFGVMATGIIWVICMIRFPLNRFFRLFTSIVTTILCYPVNLESNFPTMGIVTSVYSYDAKQNFNIFSNLSRSSYRHQ